MTKLKLTELDQSNLDSLPSNLLQWPDNELLRTYQASSNSFDTCTCETDYEYWTQAFTIVEEELIRRGLTY